MRSSSHKSGKQTVTQTDSKTAAASTLVTMTMPYSNSIALRACSLVAFFVLPSSIALTYLALRQRHELCVRPLSALLSIILGCLATHILRAVVFRHSTVISFAAFICINM